jgi:hypothetical protein
MKIYTPTQYEAEAIAWAVRHAPTLADKVQSSIEYFYELCGELGPHIDEYAKQTLIKANAFLKADYVAVNSAWADQYFRGDNS